MGKRRRQTHQGSIHNNVHRKRIRTPGLNKSDYSANSFITYNIVFNIRKKNRRIEGGKRTGIKKKIKTRKKRRKRKKEKSIKKEGS